MDALKRVAAVVIASALLVAAVMVWSQKEQRGTPDAAATQGPGWFSAACDLPEDQLRRVARGTFPPRSPEIQFIPREPHFFGSFEVTTHSGPWDYIQRVPLVLYGPGYIQPTGALNLDRPATVADLAPTLADLVGTPLPNDRPGRAITEALVPRGQRPGPPKVIVTIIWDAGGTNVLDFWPNAWPNLKKLMNEGASVQNVEVGSSPSVTPAIHATVGTGAFPDQHGIVDIPLRIGARVPDSYPNKSPKFLKLPTLADIYDKTTGNEAKIGTIAERAWHLGMMGRGALEEGGDKDIAVMTEGGDGDLVTNPDYYSLPGYLNDVPGLAQDREKVDLSDGRNDGLWLGHQIPADDKAGAANPLRSVYQLRQIKSLLTNEGFGQDDVTDMFFTNFKEVDLVGHVFNLINPEMRSVLKLTDEVLGGIVDYLDETVGKKQWVLALTADHGAGPDPRSIGAWPIDEKRLQIDISLNFGIRVTELFQAQRPTGMWLRPSALEDNRITPEEVSDFMMGYTIRDNAKEDRPLPQGYRGRGAEKLFAAAFPSDRLPEVLECAGMRQ